MDTAVPSDLDPITSDLLRRAAGGDSAAWAAIVNAHHHRLRRMVALRLDYRVASRVDASDVLQNAYLDALTQLPEYLRNPKMPLFLWLRLLTGHQLGRVHRHHLGTAARDPKREVSMYRGPMPEASSAALAAHLLGSDARPSQIAMAAERRLRLQEALQCLDPLDREVLALRHFEHLSRAEVARLLGISEAATGKRYLRALERLRVHLEAAPGGAGEWE